MQIYYKESCEEIKDCTILSLNNSRLHLVQVLFHTQLFVFDHFLLLVHSFLDLLTHHLESDNGNEVYLYASVSPKVQCKEKRRTALNYQGLRFVFKKKKKNNLSKC